MINDSWFPKILLGIYVGLFIWMGIEPYDRAVWVVENLPIVLLVAVLVIWMFRLGLSKQALHLEVRVLLVVRRIQVGMLVVKEKLAGPSSKQLI